MSRIPANVDHLTDPVQNASGALNWWSGGLVILLVSIGANYAVAQAVAEYGNLSALGGVAAIKTQTAAKDSSSPSAQPGATALPVLQGKAGEAVNRQALEAQAGKDAAKLMLRSVPSKAWVRINGKPVGRTPLLLIVAPGVYSVQMEGSARAEAARQQVDLLPQETREVVLTLQSPYPTHVRMSARSPK